MKPSRGLRGSDRRIIDRIAFIVFARICPALPLRAN
jgi:hypothetical protein